MVRLQLVALFQRLAETIIIKKSNYRPRPKLDLKVYKTNSIGYNSVPIFIKLSI